MGLAAAVPKPGEQARRIAVDLLAAILKRKQPFDESFERRVAARGLDPRDRALIYATVATALRRRGEIEGLLAQFLPRPLPRSSGPAELILLAGAAQLLFMDVPAHAAIDLAVTIAQSDGDARHFAKLVNAVLRNVAREGMARLAGIDGPRINTPDWLWNRWQKSYGEAAAHGIAKTHMSEPPLDLSAKGEAGGWAERLGGVLLPTGTIRLNSVSGAIEDIPGFSDGAWWIQDAGARLPVLLFGDMGGKTVLDLCAAPGGKTAELALRGARVTAVDKSAKRMKRLRENMARLDFSVEAVIADVESFAPGTLYDAVLLDAPCSATGTIRRHPDLPHIKNEMQIAQLTGLQSRLLDCAAKLVRKGGTLIYCTCSLEPEEGEDRLARFLESNREFSRSPITPAELSGQSQFIDENGDLRTHPAKAIGPASGLDGFFAARLVRR